MRHLELRYRALRLLYRHNQVPVWRGMHIAWSASRDVVARVLGGR